MRASEQMRSATHEILTARSLHVCRATTFRGVTGSLQIFHCLSTLLFGAVFRSIAGFLLDFEGTETPKTLFSCTAGLNSGQSGSTSSSPRKEGHLPESQGRI